MAQTAQLSGYVRDESHAVIPRAAVTAANLATGLTRQTPSNEQGLYVLASLPPGRYRLSGTAPGFQEAVIDAMQLDVGQDARLDLTLHVAGVAESVSVGPQRPLGSRDGSVGTVVDREFAENIPTSGHTFHSLLELTPGVVSTASGLAASGQRADTTYFSVDGVSANVPINRGPSLTTSGAGQQPTTILTGGFNGLASIDALQEFRVQTSSFAPEYGRTPGAQVSILTRSGTNSLHGSANGMFRNERLDARNWFANARQLPTAAVDQQHYAATVGGPIRRNKLFYFVSYEGLRLTQPRTLIGVTASDLLRGQASPTVRPFLDLFPRATGGEPPSRVGGLAEYAANITEETTFNVPSLRVDGVWRSWNAFARYNTSRSDQRQATAAHDSELSSRLSTATLGITKTLGGRAVFDVRANYTRNSLDAVQLTPARNDAADLPGSVFESGIVPSDVNMTVVLLQATAAQRGPNSANSQTQWTANATLAWQTGAHHVKFGADVRRLQPRVNYSAREAVLYLNTLADIASGVPSRLTVRQHEPVAANYDNYSLFAQDSWQMGSRLTVTYGLRYDINPPPGFPDSRHPVSPTSFDQPSEWDLDGHASRLWRTHYANIAPRVGISYAVDALGRTVLSGGIGQFFDIGTQSTAPMISSVIYPFTVTHERVGVEIPLRDADLIGPGRPTLIPPYQGTIYLVDPDLDTPVTTHWNVKVEQALKDTTTISLAYVGARGRHLLTDTVYRSPNERFPGQVEAFGNGAESRYDSLQVRYARRATAGPQVSLSYTLARSLDSGSAAFARRLPPSSGSDDWGPSDFDVRHSLAAAVTWTPGDRFQGIRGRLLNGWGVDAMLRAQGALPVTVTTGVDSFSVGVSTLTRPNRVPNTPLYIDDPNVPGGRRFNRDAFSVPPPMTQGNLPRNALRGFPVAQVDLGIRKTIVQIQRAAVGVRLDVFNVFNTPHFGLPVANLASPLFGVAQSTLNESFSSSLNPLYAIGGPRAMQIGLRVTF